MSEVRKADPVVRRRMVFIVAFAAVVGALLIFLLERYRVPLRDWILADPELSARRLRMTIMLLAALLLAPLIGFAVYLWSLGGRVLRAREFPPPGLRVARDTRVITGESAVSRGRRLKMLVVGCLVAGLALSLLLWRLASLFDQQAF
jgi:hypothetical protein